METKPKVVVTGVTGNVASWVTKMLLDQGKFSVRGTVRTPTDEKTISHLKEAFGDKYSELEVVYADLTDEKSLFDAIKGCTYVFHIASIVTQEVPKEENELIVPIVNGVTFVMKAAIAHGVKRVIFTSSTYCVSTHDGTPSVDETVWPDKYDSTLCKAKNLAEKTIWEFHEKNKGKIEAVTLIPCFIQGPPLSSKGCLSVDVIKAILLGVMPENPNYNINWVDVREVAQAHINALEAKDGNRFIIVGESKKINEVAENMKEDWGKYGYNVTTKESTVESNMSKLQETLNNKSIKELGMNYRPLRETMNDMVEAMINLGIVPDLRKK